MDTLTKNNTNYILSNMKVTTSIKLDKQTKEDAAKLAKELGLSLSSIINATLKDFVRERRVEFRLQPELNEKTKKKLLEIEQDIKEGKNLSPAFTNVEDMMDYLLKK